MTTSFPDISISTDRLVLRPFDEDDAAAYADMMNDELLTSWTTGPRPYTLAHARRWTGHDAESERTSGRGLTLAVTEFLTQRLVGSLELRTTDWRVRSTELCYAVAPWARGEGYACEAVLALAQWLFTEQGFERLELRTAADNSAAQQVAQKLGCISEGVLRGAWIARNRNDDGTWSDFRTDLIVWSLLPEDLDGGADAFAGTDGYSSYADWS